MNFCLYVFVLLQLFLVNGVDKKNPFCETRNHMHYYRDRISIDCCNNNGIRFGVKLFANWKNCAVAPKDKKENYVWTMWRIYACLIKKSHPNSKDKISITEFGKIIYADYPDETKKIIEQKMNETIDKTDGSTPSFVVEANFTDLADFDRLRQNYFIIEQEACGTKDIIKYLMPSKGKVWTGCNDYEKVHRGGSCCKNISIPFTDVHFFTTDSKQCSTLIKPLADKLGFNETVTSSIVPICLGSCILMEKGKLKIDGIMKLNVNDTIEYETLVKEFLSTYFSESIRETMSNAIKKDVNPEKIFQFGLRDLKNRIGENSEQFLDVLYGCYMHTLIGNHAKRMILRWCETPDNPKSA